MNGWGQIAKVRATHIKAYNDEAPGSNTGAATLFYNPDDLFYRGFFSPTVYERLNSE
jgi:hypothetical protein